MPLSYSDAQAVYLATLHQAAKDLHQKKKPDSFPIDPQGRTILNVALDLPTWQGIYNQVFYPERAEENLSIEQIKKSLETVLGHPIQSVTSVSLDLQTQEVGKTSVLDKTLKEHLPKDQSKDILDAYHGLAKGRIISLQQETHFHAHLIGRMVQQAVEKGRPDLLSDHTKTLFEQGVNNALLALNKKVLQLHAQALEKAYAQVSPTKPITREQADQFAIHLNKELDAARARLLPDIAKTVRQELIKTTKIQFDKNITQHLSQKLAETTTGSAYDYVHIDKGMGFITFIGASEHTAHHQELGAKNSADRMIYHHSIQQDDETVISLSERKHVRVPSLAVRNKSEAEAVPDVANKLLHLQKKYQLGGTNRVHDNNRPPNAFVYNLYTTLNKNNPTGWFDEFFNKNRQSESADRILKAAHQYNRSNIDKPLCLVQNMAVNGQGHALSLQKGNPPLVNEAALMTHMASLHTVYDALNVEDQAKANKLFDSYNAFLKTDQTSFYSYLQTNNQLDTVEKLRKDMGTPPIEDTKTIEGLVPHKTAFTQSARLALQSLFKEGAFSKHENGYTYQALSVFVEKASIGGCKSANERAQAVIGRAAILDFVSLDKKTRDNRLQTYLTPEKATHLQQIADNLEEQINQRNVVGIREHMDTLYESLNLEGAQIINSLLDQGGHAKLGTKKTGIISRFNTNNAETVTTHVHNAAQWQCHKGLIKHVLKEFNGGEEVSYRKEFSKTAKAIGLTALAGAGACGLAAAAGASIAFPPIGIAIGVGVAAAVVATGIVSLGSFIYKLLTKNARFETLQQENRQLIDNAPSLEHSADLSEKAEEPLQAEAAVSKKSSPVIPNWRRRASEPSPEPNSQSGVPLSKAEIRKLKDSSPLREPLLSQVADQEEVVSHSNAP